MSLFKIASMTEEEARVYWENVLWPCGPICPKCGSISVTRLKGKSTKPGTCKCRDCKRKFTVTTDTFMHKTHLSLKTWLLAVHLICSNKKGVSALYLSRELEIGYEAAWFMLQRIREGMKDIDGKLEGTVEADEVYVGGKSRTGMKGRGSERKTPVLVMVERTPKLDRKPHTPKTANVCTGRVILKPVSDVSKTSLQGNLLRHVERTSAIMTDEWGGYSGIEKFFAGGHGVVRHKAKEYATADGRSNNTSESVNALVRRSQRGIYHQWSKKHMQRYLWEIKFRWNHRHLSDEERRDELINRCRGKKLTYRELTE